MPGRGEAVELDRTDPLAPFRERFAIPDDDLLYMAGNSLGRPPRSALEALAHTGGEEWAGGLVGSWSYWIDLPRTGGDLLAGLLGAGSGEVLLTDQTSLNLYKLGDAALTARPGRSRVISDEGNFPSDLYVLDGLARRHGAVLHVVSGPDDVAGALGPDVALVSLSHVGYKTAAVADMAAITAAAHANGALTLWDLSHAAGIVPVDLSGSGADLAVGCTYKYLNGGPGAPAFAYVRSDLQESLHQPIQGWFGHRDMFAFGPGYEPAPGIDRFAVGTPPILSMVAAIAAIRLVAEAGIGAVREKSLALTGLLIDCFDAVLEPLGFSLATPRAATERGGHVALRHPEALRIRNALIADHAVVPDFRAPDTIRVAPSPLYTRFVDVWDAAERIRALADSRGYETAPDKRHRVT